MSTTLPQLKQDFTEGLSQISRFWGFPKGMGAIFAVLYLSPTPLSLDEIVNQTGLDQRRGQHRGPHTGAYGACASLLQAC